MKEHSPEQRATWENYFCTAAERGELSRALDQAMPIRMGGFIPASLALAWIEGNTKTFLDHVGASAFFWRHRKDPSIIEVISNVTLFGLIESDWHNRLLVTVIDGPHDPGHAWIDIAVKFGIEKEEIARLIIRRLKHSDSYARHFLRTIEDEAWSVLAAAEFRDAVQACSEHKAARNYYLFPAWWQNAKKVEATIAA